MGKNIVIYQDEGVGEFGLSCLKKFFKEDDVRLATAEAVIDGGILGMADIFVMPGGADLPYCKKLNGTGNDNLRAYVKNGGTYLGICAGAYYACRAIEFHKGRADEICGKRELNLVDATAIGSLPEFAPYYDQTLRSAASIELSIRGGQTATALYYGGCTFRLDENVKILAAYSDGRPAIIRKNNVILSGVHFEYDPERMLHYPANDETERACAQKLAAQLQGGFDWHTLLLEETIPA